MAGRSSPAEQREQLTSQRRKVDFDTYDVTVDELVRRVGRNRIDIAPIYQRQFRWDEARQSRLVESVLLGIPVPPLFMATNAVENIGVQWEVVDGLQRLLTLVHFAGDVSAKEVIGLELSDLALRNLEKLTCFEGATFDSLPEDIKATFEDRPLKIIVLNDKSETQVRFDLFERLNTGGIILTAQEIRECVYRGEFIDLLSELANTSMFSKVVSLPDARWKDGTPQEWVLRFFAYLENYETFNHSVIDFLNDFMDDAYQAPDLDHRKAVFTQTFDYLTACFPSGISSRFRGQTPVNLYEAVAVGAALALAINPDIDIQVKPEWISSDELRALTTGATNSRVRVAGRIQYCRDRFLGINVKS